MATTGTYTYNPTASTLITEALRMLGVLEESGTASSAQVTDCLPAFEIYFKGLSRYGLNLWRIETQSITLTASDCDYTPTKKFLRITDAVYRDSDGEDTTLQRLSREEYWNLADKDETGQPTQFYYDPQETQSESTVYIWPCPDSSNSGSGESIRLTGTIQAEDVGDGTYTLDIPQEWLETVKYGVATRLAPMYGYPVQERNLLLREYMGMLKDNLDYDQEDASMFIAPDYSRQID